MLEQCGTMFETMLEHCVALKIVSCNIILSRSLMNLLWVHLQVLHGMHLAISKVSVLHDNLWVHLRAHVTLL